MIEYSHNSRERGARGEETACRHLRRLGYRIVERNWACRLGELDIVARDGETLVIVEVKTRTEGSFGGPEAALSLRKRQRLIHATRAYLGMTKCELPVRFDVVTICGGAVRHYRAAFDAGAACSHGS